MKLRQLELALRYVQDYTQMEVGEFLLKLRELKDKHFLDHPEDSLMTEIEIEIK